MRVSFVIPTRNQSAFIRKCIDGCLAQGLPDAEVVVVDGLSTDGTQQVLAGYGERIRWVSEADSGQSEALNKGVRMATGELVAWINSDDYYAASDVLRRVVALFDADSELDIVYGDGMMVDPQGNPLRRYHARPLPTLKELVILPIGFALQPAVFFRKRLFDEAGGLATDLHWSMDYDLWLRLFPRARKYRYVPEVLACATFHPDAKSRRGVLRQVQEVRSLQRKYAAAFGLGLRDRLRMWWATLPRYAHWLALKLRLVRA